MTSAVEAGLHRLHSGLLYWFRDWPNADVPNWRAGAYEPPRV